MQHSAKYSEKLCQSSVFSSHLFGLHIFLAVCSEFFGLFCLQVPFTTRVTTICSTSTILKEQSGVISHGAMLSPKILFTGSIWRMH